MVKVKFYCYNCKETFNVSAKYLVAKDCIVCPNCSLKLNEQSFFNLRHAIQNLNDAHSNNDNNQRLEFNIIDDDTY